MMRRVQLGVAIALVTSLAGNAGAASFADCTSESFKTGGLARGEGEGVWVPSDFTVAFDCAALAGAALDPGPVYALFNSLFGFEPTFELPPGRFEIDTERTRPRYRFIPERPEAFGRWWQAQLGDSPPSGTPLAPIAFFMVVVLLVLGVWRLWVSRGRLDARTVSGS